MSICHGPYIVPLVSLKLDPFEHYLLQGTQSQARLKEGLQLEDGSGAAELDGLLRAGPGRCGSGLCVTCKFSLCVLCMCTVFKHVAHANSCICKHACMYVCMYLHMPYACMYVCMQCMQRIQCMHACLNTSIYACMRVLCRT